MFASSYQIGEKVKQLPCDHMFHQSCILPWLSKVRICQNSICSRRSDLMVSALHGLSGLGPALVWSLCCVLVQEPSLKGALSWILSDFCTAKIYVLSET